VNGDKGDGIRFFIFPNGEIKKNNWENKSKGPYLEMEEDEKQQLLAQRDEAIDALEEIEVKKRQLSLQLDKRNEENEEQVQKHIEEQLPDQQEANELLDQIQQEIKEEAEQQQEEGQEEGQDYQEPPREDDGLNEPLVQPEEQN